MSHSLRPKSERTSLSPDLPNPLSAALDRVRENPTDVEAWEDLNEACREHDRPDEAAALYTETLEKPMAADVLEDVGRLAADFCEEWYEDPAPTMEMLSAVLALDPKQNWAFERLTVLLTVGAKWDALLKVYDSALASSDDPKHKQILLEEAAKVARDFAGNPHRGSDYLKELLFLRLEDEQLAQTLERRFDEQERHTDLIEIWTARLPILSQEAALKARIQIAARHLDPLDDTESSYLSVEEFLEAGGDETDACEVLERIANKDGASSDVRRQALQLLDKLHTAAARHTDVISTIERQLTLAESDDERVALHRRAVEILPGIEQPEAALRHAAQILKLDPTLEDVRSNARALAEGIGRLDSYADAIVAAADETTEGPRRVELLIEAARVRRGELGDQATATRLFSRIERDEASDDAARLLACQELTDLLEEAEQWDELLVILERRADLESKESERARVLGDAARLATRLGQGERALGLWSLRLNDDKADVEALSEKIDLFAELGKHQGLVEALLARAEVGRDAEQQRADLVRAATVLAERLNDLGHAIETWKVIEERFGRVHETLDSLVSLSLLADKYEQAAELLRASIEKETDAERAVRQLGQLGDIQRIHLQENGDALKSYRNALERDPGNALAIDGVRTLLVDEDLAHYAGEALVSAFRRSGNPHEVVGLVEIRLRAAPDDGFRAKILLEAAALEEQAGRLPEALNALARAFGLSPTTGTETELHRLADATGNYGAVAGAYRDAIARLEKGDERVAVLYLAKGQVEESRLLNPEEATASYRNAVEAAPTKNEAVRALIRAGHTARLFSDAAWAITESSRAREEITESDLVFFAECAEDHGKWEAALEGMADRIAASDGLLPQVAHDLKKQLAIWYRDRLGDPDSAEMVLKRAVMDHPQEESLRLLADLQRRTPGRPLVMTLTALADVCDDVLSVLREAGDTALGAVGDPELARPLLERALTIASEKFDEVGDPETEEGFEASDVVAWSTDHLVTLCLKDGSTKEAIRLLENSAALPFAHGEKVARQYRAAQVAADGGLDDHAVKLCESVLAKESQHEGAITLLSELHEKAGRLDELLSLRKRELALERPLERRLFLRLDMSRVLGQTGADAKGRIAVLQDNLADAPGHADSVESLSAILAAEEEFEVLTETLEAQARAIVDVEPGRAASLWEKAGRIAEEFLEDEARLATNFRLSAGAAATVPVLDRLARIAEAEQQWDAEVSWLQQRVHLTPEISEAPDTIEDRRQVAVRLGRALVRSEDAASARSFLEEELRKDPASDEARRLLADIYRDMEEWSGLSVLLTGGVEFAPDDAARVEYLRSAAQVERRRLGNLEAAIPLLERAMELDPEDRGLRLSLADTLRVAESYDHAADILTGLLEEFGRRRTKERAVVHMQLARIAEAQGNLDEALEQAEAAAKIERTDAQILMLVGQLARAKGQLDKAEQAYRTLALIVSRKAPSGAEDDGEVGESTILFELYRIASEKGDDQQSKELLDSALEVATRDPNEALRLADSLRSSGQVELLLAALQQRLDSGMEGEMAARLLVTQANVLEQSERLEEALTARLSALENNPKDGKLIDTTQKLAERTNASSRFWDHVVNLARANDDKASVAGELWYRAGRAAEQEEDLVRAAELYELAQKTGHKPKRTFLALDRTLDEGSAPERVKLALERFVTSKGVDASPDVLADALYRLADFEFASGSVDAGAHHLLQALEVEAQDERALAMLEPIVRQGGASEMVVILFLRACRKAASEETLLFAFRNAARAQTVERSVLDEAIGLARTLDDGDALRELLTRTIEVAEAGDELESVRAHIVERADLARSDERFDLEVELLGKAIPLYEDSDRFELELRRATCFIEHLEQVAEGRAVLERLLESGPIDSRVWRPLLSVYRSVGELDAVERLIGEVEGDVTDEADLEALKLERVRLMVNADRLEEAELELRQILDERPHMAEAASILADLLRKAERWDELKALVEDLYSRARDREDTALVARFGIELAQLVGEEDRQEAINVMSAGLRLARESRKFLEFHLSLYTEEDDQGERADVMEHLLALERGEAARDLAFELYTLREELGDEYGAGRALEIGVKAAPDQVQLVETYEEYLRAREDAPKLAEILTVQAKQLGKTEAAALKYAEAAEIFDQALGDPELAADAVAKAYACDPSNLIYLERSAQYLVNLGRVEEALQQLKIAIDAGDETALADLLELRATIIRKERASIPAAMTQAAEDIRLALEQLIPEEQENALQGARIEVLGDLRNLHQIAGDENSERAVVLDLAEMLLSMGDSGGSIDTLASWVRDHESDTEVARLLGKRATEAGDHQAAMFAYQQLHQASEGAARVDAVLLLAGAAEAAGDATAARDALEEAFAEDPSNEALRSRMRALYEAAGDYQQLADILLAEADKTEDPAMRSSLLVDVGDLYVKGGQGETACGLYEQALELAESPYAITSKLAQAYVVLGEVDRAEAVLNEAVTAHGKRRSPELAVLQQGLARVSQARGDIDGMFTWLEAALMSDRNNADVAEELAVRAQDEGRYDVAIKALQSLTLTKGETSMSKAEAYFRQAQIASIQGDSKKALLMARRASAADAELPGLNDLLSELGG